ncbi:hypothetical protein IVA78_27170 [Bradyrhizobium sp. 137]|uniref:hypothetical protein n=1 Tax=Bradyrhizobium sp. 137 TaxID=2782614 RepID=UPI001FFB0DAD|nr:hypothetical protein [Bradyrhizobium sp. 137]MCK1758752.1 hypothetical protein [Bradyrhizobium sp. 137]
MQQAEQTNIIVGPWAHSFTPIELLWNEFQSAASEKQRVYALADQAAAGDLEAAEAACDAAYDAVEAIADAILATPFASKADVAIQAQVLLSRGADPADLLHYRPQDLTRFVQEVRGLAQL